GVVGGFEGVGGVGEGKGRVGGRVVDMELVRLAGFGEGLVQLRDLVGRRVLVVRAEQAEQRAAEIGGQVHDRAYLQRHSLRWLSDHEGAVAVDRRVQRKAAGGEERLPSARAVPAD